MTLVSQNHSLADLPVNINRKKIYIYRNYKSTSRSPGCCPNLQACRAELFACWKRPGDLPSRGRAVGRAICSLPHNSGDSPRIFSSEYDAFLWSRPLMAVYRVFKPLGLSSSRKNSLVLCFCCCLLAPRYRPKLGGHFIFGGFRPLGISRDLWRPLVVWRFLSLSWDYHTVSIMVDSVGLQQVFWKWDETLAAIHCFQRLY
jgi:hypothetical protein